MQLLLANLQSLPDVQIDAALTQAMIVVVFEKPLEAENGHFQRLYDLEEVAGHDRIGVVDQLPQSRCVQPFQSFKSLLEDLESWFVGVYFARDSTWIDVIVDQRSILAQDDLCILSYIVKGDFDADRLVVALHLAQLLGHWVGVYISWIDAIE